MLFTLVTAKILFPILKLFFAFPYPEYNVASFALDVVGAASETLKTETESQNNLIRSPSARDTTNPELKINLIQEFEKSEISKNALLEIDNLLGSSSSKPVLAQKNVKAANFYQQCVALIERWSVTYWRVPELNYSRVMIKFVIGLALGLLMLGNGNPKQISDVQSVLGAVFVSGIFLGFIAAIIAMKVIYDERNAFYREKNSNMYGVIPYVLGSVAAEVPYSLLAIVLFFVPYYFLIDFRYTAAAFFQYFLLVSGFIFVHVFLGHALGNSLSDMPLAVVATSGISELWSLFAGFLISVDEVPVYLSWITKISPAYYYLNGILASQYECPISINGTEDFSSFTFVPGSPDNTPGCRILAIDDLNNPGQVFYTTIWDFIRASYGFDGRVRVMIGSMWAYVFAMIIFSGCALKFVNASKR